jgi:hypothetical protein
MKRITRLLIIFFAFVVFWLALVLKWVPLPVSHKVEHLIRAFPLLVFVSFGCYSLAVIGYRLMTFPECPNEAKLLEQEREEARRELRRKGIKFAGDQ